MHAIIQRNIKHPVRGDLQLPRSGGLCESKPEPLSKDSDFTLFCMNIESCAEHHADMTVHLELIGLPSFVGFTETWLSNMSGCIPIPGYTLISRRNRLDGRQGGGIAFFARNSVASQVVHIL